MTIPTSEMCVQCGGRVSDPPPVVHCDACRYREALVAIETDTDDDHLRNYIRTVLDA